MHAPSALGHPAAALRRRALLLTLCLAPAASLAQGGPVMVEGQPFARHVTLAGSELRLNGTGVRAVAWFKGYAAGLYLGAPATDAAAAVAQAGPKRLQMRLLYDVPSQEFVKAFHKGVERNAPPAELPKLAERIQRFEAQIAAVGQVRKGDVVDLDFEPGRGTLFSLNGKLRGEAIAGADFYAALLLSFVGERPYDKQLRAGLLRGGA